MLLPPFNSSTVDLFPTVHTYFLTSSFSWYVLGVFYSTVILVGLVGNCLVLHAARYPALLEFNKVSLVFVTNIAAADVCIILIQGIPTMALFFADRWPLGHTLCHVLGMIKYIFIFFELYAVALLSAHKAFALTWPLRARFLTKRSAVWAVIGFWALCVVLDVLGVFGSETIVFDYRFLSCNAGIYLNPTPNWEIITIAVIIAPVNLVLAVSLFIILRVATNFKKRNQVSIQVAGGLKPRASQSPSTSETSRVGAWWERAQQLASENKATISVLSVTAVFAVSIVPGMVAHTMKYATGAPTPADLGFFQEIFYVLNTAANPPIYALTNPKFVEFYRKHWRPQRRPSF